MGVASRPSRQSFGRRQRARYTSVIKRGLEAAGYAVDAFNDPEQALAHFKNGYYDMLIFDVRMPKLNGFQLYREIRKKDSKAKVCFMTAFEVYREEFEQEFSDYNVKCFLTKPLSIKRICTRS
jgi:two-component system, OmpR family, response regulator ChvI